MNAARTLRCAAWAAAQRIATTLTTLATRTDTAAGKLRPGPAPPPDRGIRVDEARATLTDPTVEPCGFRWPGTELGIVFAQAP
ncbi:hypothetical protein ACFCYB_23265 [Streptomyces sp. NPDC056309]|uniref:hypothetical protein n=1 Tax=unclassified Streptomyces TaxID=2593676 RepID=UPI0035DACD9D